MPSSQRRAVEHRAEQPAGRLRRGRCVAAIGSDDRHVAGGRGPPRQSHVSQGEFRPRRRRGIRRQGDSFVERDALDPRCLVTKPPRRRQ
ncbi:MAG: hypothetical protein ACKOHG_04235, partial [Planctomycetia bacterium]